MTENLCCTKPRSLLWRPSPLAVLQLQPPHLLVAAAVVAVAAVAAIGAAWRAVHAMAGPAAMSSLFLLEEADISVARLPGVISVAIALRVNSTMGMDSGGMDIAIGELVGAHGVRGEARLRPFNPDSSVLGGVSEVFLLDSEAATRRLRLEHDNPCRIEPEAAPAVEHGRAHLAGTNQHQRARKVSKSRRRRDSRHHASPNVSNSAASIASRACLPAQTTNWKDWK